MPRISGLSGLFDERLPMNRKERYYTGTVLPMIVASDGFKHFGKFLALCGIPEIALEADPNTTNVQFFSEYGFKESLMDGAEKRFRDPGGRDTPDLVVYMERSLLLGVEAKFFDQPSIAERSKTVGKAGLPALSHGRWSWNQTIGSPSRASSGWFGHARANQ